MSNKGEPWIRLLELHKQPTFSNEIKIGLEDYRFDDTLPAYDTLSYAWGNDQRRKTIWCNGKSFQVGIVLWQALRQFSRWPSYEKRLLWIDRICSNQNDAKEKSQQVALMRDIFKRSRKTMAWLGSKTPRENFQISQAISGLLRLTITSFDAILKQCSREQAQSMTSDDDTIADWYRWIVLPDSLGISALLTSSWFVSLPVCFTSGKVQAIVELLSFSFSLLRYTEVDQSQRRVWVVQEVAVSRTVIVQCRNATIDFDVLVLGIMLFGRISSYRSGPDIGSGLNLVRHSELSLMTHLRHGEKGSVSLELPELLAATHRAGATDIRDKLYSLYGITSTNLSELGLSPNYNVSKRQALIDTIYSLLKTRNNLDLLEIAEGHHASDTELPSWVLAAHGPAVHGQNFLGHSEVFQTSILDAAAKHVYDKNSKKYKDVPGKRLQRAFQEIRDLSAGDRPLGMRVPLLSPSETTHLELDDKGVLHLHGQLVDKIQQVQPTKIGSPPSDQDGANLPFSLSSVKDVQTLARVLIDIDNMVMARAKSRTYLNGDSILSVYRKTLCTGEQVLRREEVLSDKEADDAFNRIRAALTGAIATTWLERKTGVDISFGVGTFFSFLAGVGLVNSIEVRSIWYLIADNVFTRALAWTEKGYLALVPEKTEAGDTVALLKGGRMPFILRPNTGAWRLLGPSYIHGIMDGEFSDSEAIGTIRLA